MPVSPEKRINGYVNLKTFDDARHWVGKGPACALCNDCALFYHKGNQFGCTASSLGGAPGTLAAHDCSEGRQPTGCKQYKKQTAGGSGTGSASSNQFEGKSGALAGLGQMAKAFDTTGSATDMMTNFVGGAGKLVAAGVVAAFTDSAEDKAARINGLRERINAANFRDAKSTTKGVQKLFGVFNDVYDYSNSSVSFENREAIADSALSKIKEGIGILRSSGGDAKKIDEFQLKYQKASLKRLNIKPDVGVFDEGPDRASEAYNKNITIINSVSLEGGPKVVTKSLNSLFKISDSLFGILGGGKSLASYDKRKLCNRAVPKIREGIEILRDEEDFDEKKLAGYEADLEKLLVRMNGIRLGKDEDYDMDYAVSLIKEVSFDGSAAVVASGLDALVTVKDGLFSLVGKGKKITPGDKRTLCNMALPKIREGIELLRIEADHDEKKLAAYEDDIESIKVKMNGIRLGADEEFSADYAAGLIRAVSFDGSSVVVASGIDALFTLKDAFFSLTGKGKELFAEPKRELCDGAIQKIQEGIGLLKNDAAFDAKKLAKYEAELADFQQKREGIQKSKAEIQAEKEAEEKRLKEERKAAAAEKMKAMFKPMGLGGLFGKKGTAKNESAPASAPEDSADKAADEPAPDAGSPVDKLKQGLGGLSKGLGGGLFGKKK